MKIEFILNFADYKSAQWLHISPRWPYALIGMGVLGFIVWMVFYSFYVKNVSWATFLLLPFIACICFYFFVSFQRKWKKTFSDKKSLGRVREFLIDDEGILVQGKSNMEKLQWSKFIYWKESKSCILIYLSGVSFVIFPKRVFQSEKQTDEFIEILTRKLVKGS